MTILPERRARLIVMVKQPRAGRVKTRLGRDIGMTRAAWWFRHQTARLLRQVADPRWETILAVTPDKEVSSPVWPPLRRVPQGSGDLGDRMGRLFRSLPPGPAVVVGADIPDVGRRHIAHAFNQLGRHDAVIGPALDGGYWLIGFRRTRPMPPALFHNVRWSSEHALTDTLATMGGLSCARIDCLRDVDTAADLSE